MLNISLHTCKCSFSYFHYHMLQNKQSNSHSLYSMTSVVVTCVICISCKVDYLHKERSYKNSTREAMLFYLIFPIQPTKCWTEFRFINTYTGNNHLLRCSEDMISKFYMFCRRYRRLKKKTENATVKLRASMILEGDVTNFVF